MHVVAQPTMPFAAMGGAVEVHQVPAAHDNLVWILVCSGTREAAIVDGPEAEPVLAYADSRGLDLVAIFNTHTHADHVGINRDLEARGLLAGLRVVGPAARRHEIPGLGEPVAEGSKVTLGAVTGRVLETPGHLDGHVSFVFGDVLFCGDTLFTGGCGRLFDGPPEAMQGSLRKLARLPGPTRVCCAHEYTLDNLRFAWSVEPENAALAERIRQVRALRAAGRSAVPSTIAEERATNPFLRCDSAHLVSHVASQMPEMTLSSIEAVFAATRALKDRGDYRKIPDDVLP